MYLYNIELQQARQWFLMLGQRHRRWASNETSLFQRVVFVHFRNLLNAGRPCIQTLLLLWTFYYKQL